MGPCLRKDAQGDAEQQVEVVLAGNILIFHVLGPNQGERSLTPAGQSAEN